MLHGVTVYIIINFREVLSHNDVVFNNNGTVSSMPKHPLVWDEERSMGNSEDDMFVLPNIALLVSVSSSQLHECISNFPHTPYTFLYHHSVPLIYNN